MSSPTSLRRNPDTGEDRLWLPLMRRYLLLVLAGNLLWEAAHLPLYTLWTEASVAAQIFAVVHCTGGDLLIATATLVLALALLGDGRWPDDARVYWRVALLAIALGIAYTVYSEWLNVVVRRTWAYAPAMPVLPLIGTGLSPLAQWLVIPAAAFHVARRSLVRS